jgi:hypothetical protein
MVWDWVGTACAFEGWRLWMGGAADQLGRCVFCVAGEQRQTKTFSAVVADPRIWRTFS